MADIWSSTEALLGLSEAEIEEVRVKSSPSSPESTESRLQEERPPEAPKSETEVPERPEAENKDTLHLKPRSLAEMLRDNANKPIGMTTDERDRLLERVDSVLTAERAQLEAYLRISEGFNDTEIAQLDAYPMRKLGQITRKMLVDRVTGRGEAPDVSYSRGPYVGPTEFGPTFSVGGPDEREEALREARNPWASSSQREYARMQYLKASTGGQKRTRKARV